MANCTPCFAIANIPFPSALNLPKYTPLPHNMIAFAPFISMCSMVYVEYLNVVVFAENIARLWCKLGVSGTSEDVNDVVSVLSGTGIYFVHAFVFALVSFEYVSCRRLAA